MCLHTSPLSHAIHDICLFLEAHNTKAQNIHHSLPDVTSTHLLLSCSEEARIGSCSQRSWGRKVRLQQASQQLKGLEESGACPGWSAPHFPPAVFPLPNPCPTAAKDHWVREGADTREKPALCPGTEARQAAPTAPLSLVASIQT